MDILSLTEFLANGLTPQTPADMDPECPICTSSYRDDPQQMVVLPYLHDFHRPCIEQWATNGRGILATCPCCRLELCKRLELAVEDWPVFELEDEDMIGWEGLRDVIHATTSSEWRTILMLTHRVLSVERESDAERTSIVSSILASYNVQPPSVNPVFVQPLQPGTVEEYVMVNIIFFLFSTIYE
jgi:ribosomal protein L23